MRWGRPPRARGRRAGSEIGTNPGTEPVAQRDPPAALLSPNGWSAQPPKLAVVALMRKMLIPLNAMLPWRQLPALA
jgi:hypothetical protein